MLGPQVSRVGVLLQRNRADVDAGSGKEDRKTATEIHSSFLNPWYEKAQPFGVPRDRILMGSPGFAHDDQAMIAHVTSPFTDKIAPYGSNPPTDPPRTSTSWARIYSLA
ncbi:hypothetical protein M0802_004087 [Mischocyttarus mexicanus]|nr:hypothetical protein M0802_004087 [Mischocyttarus mexicanus]